jgi:hypothetical protein
MQEVTEPDRFKTPKSAWLPKEMKFITGIRLSKPGWRYRKNSAASLSVNEPIFDGMNW